MATSALDISVRDHVASFAPHDTNLEKAFACVVVSHGARQDMLIAAAENAGWDTIQPASHSVAQARASEIQMLIVDLAGSDSSDDCRASIEKVAGQHGLLLLVCGNEGDPTEEIWARGLGVWLYLPGVADDADLSSLCSDALRIAERNAPQTIELHAAGRSSKRRAR